jgi:hypothetical protein
MNYKNIKIIIIITIDIKIIYLSECTTLTNDINDQAEKT